jgi:excinuclease ABC subunit C
MNKSKLDTLPTTPGVYKFLDKNGEILYIGKALNLRARVKSYFSSDLYDRPRVKQMIPFIGDVEIIETNNEIESLVLESALIKQYKPFYNSDKKDDKSYAWIYISTKDKFPTVKIIRKITGKELKRGRLFGPYPSSSATKRIFTYLRKIYPFCTCKRANSKECLYFHLGLCPGPHQGHITEEEYRKNINEIIKFLSGRKRGQIKEMESVMKEYSATKQYEKAAELRDKIEDLKYLGEKIDFEANETEQSYKKRRKIVLKQNFLDLKNELGLKNLSRIECYDISNIQGKEAYGSMVVAQDGEIKRSEYRVFRIKDIDTPNDPAMLKHVILRRFNQLNQNKYSRSPDIVLIDGGKSQLSVLRKYVPNEIHLLGISKGKRLKRKGSRLLDEFWFFSKDGIKRVDIMNKEVLIDLRDEAHRFAILHHRKARIRKGRESELSKIEGVGEKRRKLLIKQLGSIDRIKRATVKELNKIIKNRKVSEKIYNYLRQSSK